MSTFIKIIPVEIIKKKKKVCYYILRNPIKNNFRYMNSCKTKKKKKKIKKKIIDI